MRFTQPLSSLLVAIWYSSLTIAGASSSEDFTYQIKESIPPPSRWIKQSVAPPDHNIVLRIGLPQPNFHILEQHLYEVSDPDHARYGQHLSKAEVEDLVTPHPESITALNEWLFSHGISESDIVRSGAKDWVTIKVPVKLVEKMLNTTYHVWKHVNSNDYLVRTTSYSLPSNLHKHVDVIQPTTMFGRFRGAKSTISVLEKASDNLSSTLGPAIDAAGVKVDASCNRTITVSCLKQLYNAVGYNASANIGNSVGITGYLEQFANIQDLQAFFAEQRPDAVNSTFKFISVNGGVNNQTLSEAGAEADLDVQFSFGISHPVPPTFFSTAGMPPFIPDVGTPTDSNEPYSEWLDFILSHPNPPLAISTSYGDDEQTVPESFAVRVCNGFAQLGARGVSLMFSSGDGGVGDGDPDPATQQCFTNDGHNRTKFIPGFPASCPFVTAVGGTTSVPERAVFSFFSGGGFSNYDETVQKYLDTLPKGIYAGLFNPNGRNNLSRNPTFTGFIALLNDARLKAKLQPLGFLNPLIYKLGLTEGFNDITIGSNPGCGTPGFNTSKGWDPVTGFGSPNFGKLKDMLTSLSL